MGSLSLNLRYMNAAVNALASQQPMAVSSTYIYPEKIPCSRESFPLIIAPGKPSTKVKISYF